MEGESPVLEGVGRETHQRIDIAARDRHGAYTLAAPACGFHAECPRLGCLSIMEPFIRA
jgi:hypothetical protein